MLSLSLLYNVLLLIAAQVNPQMPRTFGDATVHQSHFDYAVKVDAPLPEHGGHPPTEVETKIGKQIARNLVEDGATLQMGIDNHHHYFNDIVNAMPHLVEINLI